MKINTSEYTPHGFLNRRACAILAIILPLSILAQTTSAQSEEKKKEADVVEAKTKETDVVVLGKYVVSQEQDAGYMSKNTLSSAGRISTRLLDTPQLIQIANQELLKDLGADEMLEAVQMVAGGIARRSFNGGDDQYIWGFRSGSSLKDGISLGSNAIGPMYDVDRVEVLKGPIAMTFGNSGFVGGAINYVTRQPTKRPSTEIVATVGSFDYYRGELHLSRPLTSDFRYRIDLGTTDSEYSKRRFSYYDDKFIGAGFVYDISDRTSLILDAAFSKINYNRALTFIDPATFKVFDAPDTFSYDPSGSRYNTENFRATSTLTSTLGPELGMSLFFGYVHFTNDWFRTYASGYDVATGIMKRVTANFATSQHDVITNLDFSKDLHTGPLKHMIAFGAANTFISSRGVNNSYATSDFDVNNPGDGGTVSNVTSLSSFGSRTRNSSAYVQDTVSILNDRAYAVGGIRWNTSLTGAGPVRGKAVSRYGAVFKPTKDIALHYNRSQAFVFNSAVTYLGKPFVPSLGNQQEVGIKADFMNGRIGLSATYFEISFTNVYLLFVQGPNDPNPGTQGATQGGTQTNEGYELSASLDQKFGIGDVSLIATYYAGNILNEFKLKPIGATNNTGSLFAKYSFREGGLKNFSFGAGANSHGSRLGGKIAQIPNSPYIRFPEYTTYNAFASYTRGHFRYQMNIDNIGDTKFIEGAEIPFWIFTNPGRSFKFTVAYKF